MTRLLSILTVLSLVLGAALPAHATPRTRVEYVVTEVNPFTKGIERTQRFTDKGTADRAYASLSRAHWVKWRFAGINEPLRFRRFASSAAAQQFIDTDGPSKTGKLGFAILTNETRNVATKVSMKPVVVPVTGGGPRPTNPDRVIDTIDRIIGIIDR
jgi:hypothetical protein